MKDTINELFNAARQTGTAIAEKAKAAGQAAGCIFFQNGRYFFVRKISMCALKFYFQRGHDAHDES